MRLSRSLLTLCIAFLAGLHGCADEEPSARAVQTLQVERGIQPPLAPVAPAGPALEHQTTSKAASSLDLAISKLARSLRASLPQGFSEIWIRQEPHYEVVINVKPPYDRKGILMHANSAVRRLIVFREVSRTRPEIVEASNRIVAATHGGPEWQGGYDVKADRFELIVDSERDASQLRPMIPSDLIQDTEIEVN